jgi:hypothetical protein
MIPRILLLVCFSYLSLNAQTKLVYSFDVSPQQQKENIALIEAYFGSPKHIKNTYVWEKQGAGYHYKLELKANKANFRYTGKAIQVERKIRKIRKRIKR